MCSSDLVEGEIYETPFQAFETVHAVNLPPPEQKRKPETVMSSLKDAKAVAKGGNPEGWGQVLDVTPKFDKFGLGFNPGQQSAAPRASSLSTPVKFSRPCATQEGHVNAVGDDRDDATISMIGFVRVFQARHSTIGLLWMLSKFQALRSNFLVSFIIIS